MGWAWTRHLARHCDLTVITEEQFRGDLDRALQQVDAHERPVFHFISIGDEARAQFWRQGDWRFYRHYRRWQWEALLLARKLLAATDFDVVHQLNMIGYREPGFLWKLPLPSV